jgi:hypothetical protein
MRPDTGIATDGNACNVAVEDDDGDYASKRDAVPEPGCVAKRSSSA